VLFTRVRHFRISSIFTGLRGIRILGSSHTRSCIDHPLRAVVDVLIDHPPRRSGVYILWCWIKMQDLGSSQIHPSVGKMVPGT